MGTDDKALAASPARPRARLFAFAALASIAAGVSYVGHQTYRAATDSFVAPIILSPDSDIVIAGRVHASQLAAERSRTASDLDAIGETLAAGHNAITRLKSLQRSPDSTNAWTSGVSARQASAGYAEDKMLRDQRAVLRDMASKQEHLVAEGRANLEAGLISRTDLNREIQVQNELQLSILENERTRHQVRTQIQQMTVAQQSLAGAAPPMPEVVSREEQMVRIELEIMRLESEHRAKLFEQKLLTEKMAMLDGLDAQLKTRPAYRASEHSMDVAFVPYTQMDGVHEGAVVHECIWGIFHCKAVGEVTELVPGEVVLPDPWGNQARGQYAVLKLADHESAKAKTLRVRTGGTGSANANKPTTGPERTAAK